MSPEEVSLLQDVGRVIIANLLSLFPLAILYGVYLVLVMAAMYSLTKRGLSTRSSLALLLFLFAMFSVMLINLITTFVFNLRLIQGPLVNHPEMSFDERVTLANDSIGIVAAISTWTGTGSGVLISLQFLAGDAVVVWRAWVLCVEQRKTMIIPLTLMLITCVMSTLWLIISTMVYHASIPVLPSHVLDKISYATSACSLATNVTSTAVIGYQTYKYIQFVKKSAIGYSPAISSFVFLTESGVLYCVIQCITAALTVPQIYTPDLREEVGSVWLNIMLFASAAYPALVILVVVNRQSIADHTMLNGPEAGRDIGTHISFAARSMEQKTNNLGASMLSTSHESEGNGSIGTYAGQP